MNVGTVTVNPQVVLEDFEETYRLFVQTSGLPDSPVVKAGFYTAAKQMVLEEPVPDDVAQKEVLRRLELSRVAAINDYLEQIEMMFESVGESRLLA